MSNEVTVFKFEDEDIRVELDEEGNPLICIADVCKALGFTGSAAVSQAASKIDKDDIHRINIVDSKGRQQISCAAR